MNTPSLKISMVLYSVKIINIEGIPGTGISTQINLIKNKYLNEKILINKIGYSRESVIEAIDKMKSTDCSIVLNDGSFGRFLTNELMSGNTIQQLNLEGIIRDYEYLAHGNSFVNIVLIPESIEPYLKRIIERDRILKVKSSLESVEYYEFYLRTLCNIHNLMITVNLKFNHIEISEIDSILTIFNKIEKLI
jgi:hypothetical protein